MKNATLPAYKAQFASAANELPFVWELFLVSHCKATFPEPLGHVLFSCGILIFRQGLALCQLDSSLEVSTLGCKATFPEPLGHVLFSCGILIFRQGLALCQLDSSLEVSTLGCSTTHNTLQVLQRTCSAHWLILIPPF